MVITKLPYIVGRRLDEDHAPREELTSLLVRPYEAHQIELEHRGHRFVRYADDCNIYVRSHRAGRRVMNGVTRFLETKLKLKVNTEPHRVCRRLFGLSQATIASSLICA